MSMTAIDTFAWIVFIVSVAVVFVALAQLPGKTARERNHPQFPRRTMLGS